MLQFFVVAFLWNVGTTQKTITDVSKEIMDKSMEGVWQFEVSGVQSMYQKGLLFIDKENDDYKVSLKFDHGILSAYDVEVHDGQLQFNTNISGLERISFVLLFEENELTGEGYSKTNTSQIKGSRKVPGP